MSHTSCEDMTAAQVQQWLAKMGWGEKFRSEAMEGQTGADVLALLENWEKVSASFGLKIVQLLTLQRQLARLLAEGWCEQSNAGTITRVTQVTNQHIKTLNNYAENVSISGTSTVANKPSDMAPGRTSAAAGLLQQLESELQAALQEHNQQYNAQEKGSVYICGSVYRVSCGVCGQTQVTISPEEQKGKARFKSYLQQHVLRGEGHRGAYQRAQGSVPDKYHAKRPPVDGCVPTISQLLLQSDVTSSQWTACSTPKGAQHTCGRVIVYKQTATGTSGSFGHNCKQHEESCKRNTANKRKRASKKAPQKGCANTLSFKKVTTEEWRQQVAAPLREPRCADTGPNAADTAGRSMSPPARDSSS